MKADPDLSARISEEFDLRRQSSDLPNEIAALLDENRLGGDEIFDEYDFDSYALSVRDAFNRPALLVQNNSFALPASRLWGEVLASCRPVLETALPAVGRIDFVNHDRLAWGGTGFLVRNDIVVTNAHVARLFVTGDSGGWRFRNNRSGETVSARIDFRHEHQLQVTAAFRLEEILHVELSPGPDIALFRAPGASRAARPIEPAAGPVAVDQLVAAIGYPSRETRLTPSVAKIYRRIFGDVYDVKRLSPGIVKRVGGNTLSHDCSTLHGSSGSPIVDLLSGQLVGLHWEGDAFENNAVTAAIVGEFIDRFS